MDSKPTSTLEVKILNCKDLKPTNFNFFQKLIAFVSVALASDDPERRPRSQHQKTTTEEEQDSNLEWNREMSFDLDGIRFDDCDHLYLAFAFFIPGNLIFDDKMIGEVRVPFKDLIKEGSDGVARYRSYEVRTVDGRPNGVLHFSYKFDLKKGLRVDCGGSVDCCDQKAKIDTLPDVAKIEYPVIDWNEVSGSCGVMAQEAAVGGGLGANVLPRPAEVVHTEHNAFPVSGTVGNVNAANGSCGLAAQEAAIGVSVYSRSAEVVHTAHDGFPLSGGLHSGLQEPNMGYYPPPPGPPPPMFHMYPPGPPPPGLPPHMLYQHQPHSPGSPHHVGVPFPGLHHLPPPPLHASGNFWGNGGGYDRGSGHGGGESRLVEDRNVKDRGIGVHYPDYWSGK